jgi:hypothetical protein
LAYEAKAFGLKKKEDSPLFSRVDAIVQSARWSLGCFKFHFGPGMYVLVISYVHLSPLKELK